MHSGCLNTLIWVLKKTPPMDRGFIIPFKIKCYKRNLAVPVGIKYIWQQQCTLVMLEKRKFVWSLFFGHMQLVLQSFNKFSSVIFRYNAHVTF